jgi:hypothetical protein
MAPPNRALHERRPGWLIRGGEFFSGPIALILRLTNLVPLAAISFLLGALISRFGFLHDLELRAAAHWNSMSIQRKQFFEERADKRRA